MMMNLMALSMICDTNRMLLCSIPGTLRVQLGRYHAHS